jgi:hypothetical protein
LILCSRRWTHTHLADTLCTDGADQRIGLSRSKTLNREIGRRRPKRNATRTLASNRSTATPEVIVRYHWGVAAPNPFRAECFVSPRDMNATTGKVCGASIDPEKGECADDMIYTGCRRPLRSPKSRLRY